MSRGAGPNSKLSTRYDMLYVTQLRFAIHKTSVTIGPMSDTFKTKPARVQIDEARRKHGEAHINWHTDVTFSRYQGDKEWTARSKYRKYRDWKDNYDY